MQHLGRGPNVALCIGSAATCIANKGRFVRRQARGRGKVSLSAQKLPQFKGAAAKTGVPPEGNILLFKLKVNNLSLNYIVR